MNTHKNTLILICKAVKFYALKDEDAFFEWIKKIPCIKKTSGQHDELYLHIDNTPLSDQDLQDLIALFYRYHIDMKQLQQFLTTENRAWFYENKLAFWRPHVFGGKSHQNRNYFR